jgi:hypothetical protein
MGNRRFTLPLIEVKAKKSEFEILGSLTAEGSGA